MAGFSVGGLATGLDTKTMIAQLLQVERSAQIGPKRRKAEADQRSAAMSDLINLMKEVRTAAEGVDTDSEAAAVTATSADVEKFTVTGDGNALPGNYQLAIGSLAKSQKDMGTLGTSLTDSVQEGTYTIQVEGEDAIDFLVDGNNNTISGLITAINSSDAKVNASTIFDGTNYTLLITAEESGKGVLYSARNGADWSDLDGNKNGISTYQAAQDANFMIDGIAITSDSNEITDAVTGLTINLIETTDFDKDGNPTELINLDVQADSTKTTENVEALTSAIGKVLGNLKDKMSSSEDRAGVLAFDSTARMLRGSISNALINRQNGNEGTYNSLTMIGIGQDRYGNISFDKDEFAEALAKDKDGVMKLITDEDGLADRFKDMADDYTFTDGFLTIRQTMYTNRSSSISDSIARMEERVEAYGDRLKRQFAKLEQMVSGLNQQSSALSSLR
jgi:flagellar hook-associated protein 2